MKITINPFSPYSINEALQTVEAYRNSLDAKADELCRRLADMGALTAEWNFSGVLYAGDIDYNITVVQAGPSAYRILASGQTVLLLEFGAGVRFGYGHPQAGQFGMGPGTYPGQVHAFDKRGWWFGKGKTKIHTYGNAPGMAMYNSAKDIRAEIEKVAREVFQS